MSAILRAMMSPVRLSREWRERRGGLWTWKRGWVYLEVYRVRTKAGIHYRWYGPGQNQGLEKELGVAAREAQRSVLPYLMRVAAMKAAGRN